nr:hypothetical protein [Tanacetum cinerariifolium]
MEIREEVGVERSTELRSNDTKEMVNVLSSMEATNILTSGVAAVSVPPVAGVSTVSVPLVAGVSTVGVPTVTKDKGKEKVVESKEPKKKKLQEQIDAQVAREMEEEIAREDQRMNEQLARDAEIARIHAEEELKMLIDRLDRSNKVIAKHLQEYEQSKAELTIRENIELINELEQREFYMLVLRSPTGWKTKHFRGMTLEKIKEKFIPVWKKIKDFMPMSSKEEAKRVKRKGLRLEQGSAKRMNTSEDVSEEDLKGMMQLVHVDEVIPMPVRLIIRRITLLRVVGYSFLEEPIKKCSSCGALYTTDYCCSEGSLRDKIICDLNKTPDLFQEPPQNCPKCGNPVDGYYCQGCALLRKKCRKICLHIVLKMEFSKILLSHPMTMPTLLMLFKSHSLSNKTPVKIPHKVLHKSTTIVVTDIPVCYDDDDENYTIAITPILSTEEPDNSLSIGYEHLDTILTTKLDEMLKSSVENLVPIPSESEGIPDNMCDVP